MPNQFGYELAPRIYREATYSKYIVDEYTIPINPETALNLLAPVPTLHQSEATKFVFRK